MKKIEAIVRPEKFEEVKEALGKHGVKGLTINPGIRLRSAEGAEKLLPRHSCGTHPAP
jgi:nitrogen regulatory protein PII